MEVRFRVFESTTKSWQALCGQAAEFATEVGRERLIGISTAAAGGVEIGGTGACGVVIVWYWGEE